MKELGFSFLLVFSSLFVVMVGGRMEDRKGFMACRTGKTIVTFSQGERAEESPELDEQMTLPSASGCVWPPPIPSRALFRLAGHRAVRSEEQSPEGYSRNPSTLPMAAPPAQKTKASQSSQSGWAEAPKEYRSSSEFSLLPSD